ncbi:MAG: hypothetical protein LBN39_06835 [Planctomycetaceae bacterium]|nr:hypothetical protein [Planctomycetaceae bacterium]
MSHPSLDSLSYSVDTYTSVPLPQTPPATLSATLSDIGTSLKELLSVQKQQTALLTELAVIAQRSHYRKAIDLGLWKRSNPELAEFCKRAAGKLERIQSDLLSTITEEVDDNYETMMDSEFMLSEFVDRFGLKFMQLNSLLQILTQLGNAPDIQLHTEPQKVQDRKN